MNNNNIFVSAHQERIRKTSNISADLYIILLQYYRKIFNAKKDMTERYRLK